MPSERATTRETNMTVFSPQLYGEDATREYDWEASVRDLGAGAGSIICPSCCVGHDYNDEVPYDREDDGCVECKNTGRVMVSI